MTRLQPSINAGQELGKILDRMYLALGVTAKDDVDHKQRLAAYLEILGTARIPVFLWEKLYRRAMVTRAYKRANGDFCSFYLTPEDLISEYPNLQKELGEKKSDDAPVADCPQTHDADALDRLVFYILGGIEEVVLPCHACRPAANEERRKEKAYIKRENVLKLAPAINENRPHEPRPRSEYSLEEIAAMEIEHNRLVRQIVEDQSAHVHLLLVWDEGGQVFKLPHRADMTFSLDVVSKKIADYRQIAEGK